MAPQPLSRSKAQDYVASLDMLPGREKQIALAMQAIAGWARIEAELGIMFASLVGAREPSAMSLYAAVRSFDVQRTLLETAARELLPTRYADMVLAVLIVVARAAVIRHKFAHWMWGALRDLPDALLLIDPKCLWRRRVAYLQYWKRKRKYSMDPQVILDTPDYDLSLMTVYRTQDLIEIKERIKKSTAYVSLIHEIVLVGASERRRIYNKLCGEPEIQKALQAHQEAQGRGRKALRTSRAKGSP